MAQRHVPVTPGRRPGRNSLADQKAKRRFGDCKKLATEAGLTPSQLQAFESVLDHDIQLIWGPPECTRQPKDPSEYDLP